MAYKCFTITVDFIKEYVNKQLAIEDTPIEYQKALCLMLETVLHKCGQYQGFKYLCCDQEYKRRYY